LYHSIIQSTSARVHEHHPIIFIYLYFKPYTLGIPSSSFFPQSSRGISDLWPDLAMPRDIRYTAHRQTTLATLTWLWEASRRRQGCWRRWDRDQGSPNLAEITSANPRPTSTDIGQLPLDQPGLAPSANLNRHRPTSPRPTRSSPLGQPRPTSADIDQVGRGAVKM
jgi:hypothetical protein